MTNEPNDKTVGDELRDIAENAPYPFPDRDKILALALRLNTNQGEALRAGGARSTGSTTEMAGPAITTPGEIRALFDKAIGTQKGNRFTFSFETEQQALRAFEYLADLGSLGTLHE